MKQTKKAKKILISISDLAREFECDRSTVRNYLERSDVQPVERSANKSLFDKRIASEAIRLHKESGRRGSSNPELRNEKIREEIRKLKIANDNKEGRLIDRQKGLEVIARMAQRMRNELEQKLYNEFPSQVVGLEIPQARVFGKRLFDSVMGEFETAGEEWQKL